MTEDELQSLSLRAAELLTDRHAEKLRASESISIGFSFHRGMRRVELSISDSVAETLMEFFADVPDLEDEEAIDLGLDFLDGVLAEHLASDREAMPRLDPISYLFENHSVHLCGGLRRPKLEAEADALLRDSGFADDE